MISKNFKPFCLEVWGDYACFTRPEMKVERVSYDVPTPSSVRAIFESISWKPAIRWHVNKIEVLKPIKWTSLRRNEVSFIASNESGFFIDDLGNDGKLKNRQQRAGLFLKNVRYRLYATIEFIPLTKRSNFKFQTVPTFLWDTDEEDFMRSEIKLFEGKIDRYRNSETPGKYLAIFERRARKGQCFNQPYLGCREFSCTFRLVDEPENESLRPIEETRDLGYMLYDMDFTDLENPKPMFFRARMENGVVEVPSWDSEEVLK